MTDQIRSADLLVRTALSDPAILSSLKADPEGTLKKLGEDVVATLPRALRDPDPPTNNTIWLIVIISFAVIMLWSAYVLGAGVDHELKKDITYVSKSETVLTLFTTVVGFLAGLLSPSPIKK